MEAIKNIDQLKVPDSVKKDLVEFLNQILKLYSDDLISIMAFGSSTTGDYVENASDINLMIVYSDLNITDLNSVAQVSKAWLKKRSFSPRFISMNNLTSSSRFFQIDMLEMKDMHITLYGKDLFNDLAIVKTSLHWQLSYEIKAMRMRIKQQFWKSCGDELFMRRILLERFTSITHLSRVLLHLQGKPVPADYNGIHKLAVKELGLSAEYFNYMKSLKEGKAKFDNKALTQMFTELMDVIRIIDAKSDQVQP